MKSPQHIIMMMAALFAADQPISVGGKIDDLANYVCIYTDGQFSDHTLSVWFNPVTKQFIRKDESMWQGEQTRYTPTTFLWFVELLPEDDEHFQRWIAGIRKVAELMS